MRFENCRVVVFDTVNTDDMLSGVESDDGLAVCGGNGDTLELLKALSPDRLVGKEQAPNGLADLRLKGARVLLVDLVPWGAHTRFEGHAVVIVWAARRVFQVASDNVEDEDRGCVDDFANDFADELCWQLHGDGDASRYWGATAQVRRDWISGKELDLWRNHMVVRDDCERDFLKVKVWPKGDWELLKGKLGPSLAYHVGLDVFVGKDLPLFFITCDAVVVTG